MFPPNTNQQAKNGPLFAYIQGALVAPLIAQSYSLYAAFSIVGNYKIFGVFLYIMPNFNQLFLVVFVLKQRFVTKNYKKVKRHHKQPLYVAKIGKVYYNKK